MALYMLFFFWGGETSTYLLVKMKIAGVVVDPDPIHQGDCCKGESMVGKNISDDPSLHHENQ